MITTENAASLRQRYLEVDTSNVADVLDDLGLRSRDCIPRSSPSRLTAAGSPGRHSPSGDR